MRRRNAALCLALTLSAGAVCAEPFQAPRLYDEGLDLGGRYRGSLVEGHRPGYFPIRVPSRTAILPMANGRFEIFVTPNLVSYREATARAAGAAQRYCGTAGGGIAAVIERQAPYAEENLESWNFTGRCR